VFFEKQHGQYCFSILLIDDKRRIGLWDPYRITMCLIKENDMTRFANTALAVFAAFVLTLGSIGAIVTVPPAQAAAPAALATVELA
jgi:hypothetical protein